MIIENRTERCLRLARETHFCPHCQQKLSCCQAPAFHVGDGLGWGSELLFICLNDECSLFSKGWQEFEDRYGQSASCRYVLCPGEEKGGAMMVGGSDAFKGSEVDVEALSRQNRRFMKEQEAKAALASCLVEKNLAPVIYLLTDEHAELAARKRAAELLLELKDLSCIDPLRNHSFRDPNLEQQVNMNITKLLATMFRKECPVCAEIIKSQANTCKECGHIF